MNRNQNFFTRVVAPAALVLGLVTLGNAALQDDEQPSPITIEDNRDFITGSDGYSANVPNAEAPCVGDLPGSRYSLNDDGTVTLRKTSACELVRPSVKSSYAECLAVRKLAEVVIEPQNKYPQIVPVVPESAPTDTNILASLSLAEQQCVVEARIAVPQELEDCINDIRPGESFPFPSTSIISEDLSITTNTTIPKGAYAECERVVTSTEAPEAPAAVAIPGNGEVTG